MKFETVHGVSLPKIGFGTWKIGGEGTANPAEDERGLAALHSALDLGYTHFDTAEYYAAGHAEELLGQAIRASRLARETLFVTSKVSPEHLAYDRVLTCCANSLRRLGMEYLDLYLIHWPMKGMNLPETFRALNQLVREGKVRHLGVSNFDLNLLKQACALSETPLLTNQVSYSIADRSSVENGVLAYCQANEILLTAYSPVKRRMTRSPRFKALAQAAGLTPEQLALAWIANQSRVITIPMSLSREHQAENLAAGEVVLETALMEKLNALA